MKEYGIDICKDAVSLPGVWLQYLCRGTDEGKLYAPGKEAFVSRGPSIVFTRYHESGGRWNPFAWRHAAAKPCKRILGYDVNLLCLSTILNDMSCGKEKVADYENPVQAASDF